MSGDASTAGLSEADGAGVKVAAKGPKTVRSVHHAVGLLRTLCESHRPLGVTELSELSGLSKPAIHALLATLCSERLVRQDPDTRRYSPGWELAVLAQTITDGNQLVRGAQQELPALAAAIGETVFVAVVEEDAIVILDSVMGRRPIQLIARPGSRVPLHASAAGKVALGWGAGRADVTSAQYLEKFTARTVTDLVALEEEIRIGKERGYMTNDGEHQVGISSISVPVVARGVGLAAIFTTAFPSESLTPEFEQMVVAELRAAADRTVQD